MGDTVPTTEQSTIAETDTTSVPVPGLPDDFVEGKPLPNPMIGGRESLSAEAKKEIKQLSGPRPGRFLIELAINWATIAATMWAAAWVNNPWFYVGTILFIGTRQNILGLLIHDQTHYLCARKPWADAVTNLFAAWPIIVVSIEGYAKIHLAHHSFYFSENDPDFVRKRGKDWTFPMKVRFLFWLFFKDAIGGSFMALLLGKREPKKELISRPPVLPTWCRILYYAAIIGLSVWLGFWKLLLLLWIVPLLVVLPVIVRFSAICEHKYNVLGGKV
ncbi:MAG: fatty acid desaturase, partial [Verrucomicrobia bacterium]|nr:fatty acid desaturase [Verrucomicrobiota bacterium]